MDWVDVLKTMGPVGTFVLGLAGLYKMGIISVGKNGNGNKKEAVVVAPNPNSGGNGLIAHEDRREMMDVLRSIDKNTSMSMEFQREARDDGKSMAAGIATLVARDSR